MAINTQNKRRSALGWMCPLPVPDATMTAADRRSVKWFYRLSYNLKTFAASLSLLAKDTRSVSITAKDTRTI